MTARLVALYRDLMAGQGADERCRRIARRAPAMRAAILPSPLTGGIGPAFPVRRLPRPARVGNPSEPASPRLVRLAVHRYRGTSHHPESAMTGLRLYRRLLEYVRPYWWAFGLAVVGMVVVAAGDLIMAMLVIPIVNNFQHPDPARTQWLPLAVIGVFLFRGIGSYISEYGMAYTGHRVVFDLRRALIDKLLRLPTPYYDVTPAGVIQSKLTFDAHQLASAASGTITTAIRSTLTIAAQPRLAALHQLEADGDDVLRAADRGRRHPLLQPPAAAHRARRANPYRRDDARARRDDRRASDRPRLRRRGVRADARRQGRERAAHVDDQAVVGQRRELAAHADARGDRRRRDHLARAVAEPDRRPGPRHLRVLRSRAADAARADQVAVGHQRGDPARSRGGRKHLRPARPRSRAGRRDGQTRPRRRRIAVRSHLVALFRRGARSAERRLDHGAAG